MQVSKWLDRVEDLLYFIIGSLLVGAAVALLILTVLSFVRTTAGGDVGQAVLQRQSNGERAQIEKEGD